MTADPRWLDGLDEARRGLWRSAIESFAAAAAADPCDPSPAIAEALCLVERGLLNQAIVRLEMAPALRDPPPAWATRLAWLRAAVHLQAGDAYAAQRAADALPRALRRRALATIWLNSGEVDRGVRALCASVERKKARPY
ncbi:hypothetical protein KKF91_04515 [Myxococcota bacterium]|nr:hypothetical protein [Myxococcota bacterium]MBU1429810.1 hypothetical protein [Myxococcota bacterium]MBU1897796.1 hypothetical protein [Myxococcota bacterium]